ncbi:ABC transporter permease [Kitasatospora camelliae]|uniref:ABC transporter permease n=1 Tax=Kitasatospora camelliae TaxID=3156397 RepID=A0AAU8JW43_9ACTN
MTTAAPATTAADAAPGTARTTPVRRMLALGRTETTLLLRNRTALFMALAMPPVMIVGLRGILEAQAGSHPGIDLHATLVNGVAGLILMMVVYYNLTGSFVARRGELVLKRLRTGEASDVEILAGTALPSVVLALLQCALLGGAAAVLMGLPMPVNPLLMIIGLTLAIALLGALAAVTSSFTKTVESAGLTTMPLMLLAQFGSGLLIPLETMPQPIAAACKTLPTTPAFQLLRLGWFGTDDADPATDFLGTWSQGAFHLMLGVLWTATAFWAAHRWFRWEPRR